MTRIQELFEKLYSEDNEVDPAILASARWISQDGYNLPRINRAYRYYRDGYHARDEELAMLPSETAAAERMSGGVL